MKKHSHTIDIAFTLALLCVFAVTVLLVLVSGARAYRDIQTSLEHSYTARTCVSYIAAKARHYDELGALSVGRLGEVPALCLHEQPGPGEEYITYIYYHEGWVRELYAPADTSLDPDAGLTVIEADGLDFLPAGDDLLQVICSGTDGTESHLWLHLRSGGEAA